MSRHLERARLPAGKPGGLKRDHPAPTLPFPVGEEDPSPVPEPGWACERSEESSLLPGLPAWDRETRRLVAWFRSASLPAQAFKLGPGLSVADARRFYLSLQQDIAAGPLGPRARTGALQADLRALWEVFRKQ